MRADMFKVIVERPRWGSRHAPAAKLKRRTDPGCTFIGHKRHAWESAAYTKSLSENLAPLRRFLFKQRGRLWNDVFSEICKQLDTGSTVKMHIREHLEDFIMVSIHIDANGMWLGRGRFGGVQPLDGWWPDLYVDPIDGRVKETAQLRQLLGIERRSYRRWLGPYTEGPFDDFELLSPSHVLMKRSGIWFELRLTRDPRCTEAHLRHQLIEQSWRDQPGGWEVGSMKQLSKKQLKMHGLKNSGGVD
ncbi:MAG: hypothetical protein AAGE86_03490 [Pseudomonadota bacterium]